MFILSVAFVTPLLHLPYSCANRDRRTRVSPARSLGATSSVYKDMVSAIRSGSLTNALCAILLHQHIRKSSSLHSTMSNMLSDDPAGASFRVVRREPGQSTSNIPIFAATPWTACTLLDNESNKKASPNSDIVREDFQDGVFVLHNVLSRDECRRIIQLSESMGYTPDAPVSLGRNIRQNDSCVWIMDETVNQKIFQRVQSHLPDTIALPPTGKPAKIVAGPVIGLNQRYRFYRYNTNDVFKMHTDGAWTFSGLRNSSQGTQDTKIWQPVLVDDMFRGQALSWLTFLLYLNDDFEGGATSFVQPRVNTFPFGVDDPTSASTVFNVTPVQGSVLCFFHGSHPLSLLHSGATVTNGTKYVARTDVVYYSPAVDRVDHEDEL